MTNPRDLSGRVLVVDDEETVRAVCERMLGKQGLELRTADDGAGALAALKKWPADIVLTDVSMPGRINGVRLTEEIKNLYPTTDVILMTAFPALETAIPALKHGAYDYMIKPFVQDVLISTIKRCFEKRRLSGELNRETRLKEELQAAYAELQKVERLKESFLARINHELLTPLVPASLAVEALAADITRPESRKIFDTLRSSLIRLQDVIDNLLLFSELQNEGPDYYRDMVDAVGLLKKVMTKFEPRWKERAQDVRLELEGAPSPLWASPKLLETAYKHLLLNAVQFTPREGRITVRAKQTDDEFLVSFADSGEGIPQDHLSKIFDSFYQAADFLTREVGGLGLGLAIVRRIAEAHGGEVSVSSVAGQGSVFSLRLPVRSREEKQFMRSLRGDDKPSSAQGRG